MDGFMTLDEALYVVEWKDHGAEFYVDDDGRLTMSIYVRDTDLIDDGDDDAFTLKPLTVKRDVDPDEDGRVQIRELIHWYLCHEADETLFFDGEQTFYPDHPTNQEKLIDA